MAIDKVRNHFKQYGIEDQIMELDTSSATVELAAKALNCEPGMIAKTLSFKVRDDVIVIVTSGEARIDNHKYKQTFKVKAKMVPFNEVETLVGHEVGGVCPFGLNDGIKVYLDASLKDYDVVYPACGSTNSAIKLTLAELEKYSRFDSWIDVCKERIN